VRTGLRRRWHRVVDVDLSRYFDTIRHDRMLAKVARRISDGKVLAMPSGRSRRLGMITPHEPDTICAPCRNGRTLTWNI
jgi:hypothetical protein